MLKKRLIGVVTIKDGWAVQSFGYQRYLPLGKPECLIKNLDRWGADEILVQVIDRSRQKIAPDFSLLERIGKLGLSTPLIYGGGIRNVDDGVKAIHYGADRLVVDALLHD
ncbi:MAG: HisA/HisF-related TIM barrel protein, partial [Pseudanabaena sp.]